MVARTPFSVTVTLEPDQSSGDMIASGSWEFFEINKAVGGDLEISLDKGNQWFPWPVGMHFRPDHGFNDLRFRNIGDTAVTVTCVIGNGVAVDNRMSGLAANDGESGIPVAVQGLVGGALWRAPADVEMWHMQQNLPTRMDTEVYIDLPVPPAGKGTYLLQLSITGVTSYVYCQHRRWDDLGELSAYRWSPLSGGVNAEYSLGAWLPQYSPLVPNSRLRIATGSSQTLSYDLRGFFA